MSTCNFTLSWSIDFIIQSILMLIASVFNRKVLNCLFQLNIYVDIIKTSWSYFKQIENIWKCSESILHDRTSEISSIFGMSYLYYVLFSGSFRQSCLFCLTIAHFGITLLVFTRPARCLISLLHFLY